MSAAASKTPVDLGNAETDKLHAQMTPSSGNQATKNTRVVDDCEDVFLAEIDCEQGDYPFPRCLMPPFVYHIDYEPQDALSPVYDYRHIYVPCEHEFPHNGWRCIGPCMLTEMELRERDATFEEMIDKCAGNHSWTNDHYFCDVTGQSLCSRHIEEQDIKYGKCLRCGLLSWSNVEQWMKDVTLVSVRPRSGSARRTGKVKRPRVVPGFIKYEDY